MEFIVLILIGLGVWWLIAKVNRASINATAMAEGRPFSELGEGSLWWRSWYTAEPNPRKPGTFYMQYVTAVLDGNRICVFGTVYPKSKDPKPLESDRFKLLGEHRFEPGDRIEVREHMFPVIDYSWTQNSTGNGGYWKTTPRHDRGAAIILLQNSGHISILVQFWLVGSDIHASNLAVDLRATLAGAPSVASAETQIPAIERSANAAKIEGFDI